MYARARRSLSPCKGCRRTTGRPTHRADTVSVTTRDVKARAGTTRAITTCKRRSRKLDYSPLFGSLCTMNIHPKYLLQTLIGRGRVDKKKPRPQTRKGRLMLQHALSVIADHVPSLPHSFEFWHRVPSATLVAATLSKPLSRECLFNPLSERLSTLPGSGVYVAREPHLPRNESVSHCRARGAPQAVQRAEVYSPPLSVQPENEGVSQVLISC